MNEWIRLFGGLVDFANVYWLQKCIRTMVCGMVLLPVILLVRQFNRGRNAHVNYYSILLLLPMVFMGMNKLYFLTDWVYITIYVNKFVRPIHGMVYFGIVFLLLGRFCVKELRLKRSVNRLSLLEKDRTWNRAMHTVTDGNRMGLAGRYLSRVRVYETQEEISPYSGGIVHPFVVIPCRLKREWADEQLYTVFCHELIHIRAGHILWMRLFDLLCIYWWINPLVYLCRRMLREDMELVCDGTCIHEFGICRTQYGGLLLHMIELLQGVRREGTLSFFRQNDFRELKGRILCLDRTCTRKRFRQSRRLVSVLFGVGLVLGCGVIMATSYPRYTRMKEISLYTEDLRMLAYDSPELREAVRVVDGRLEIDEGKFREVLTEQQVEDEYVYVAFDTIMKVPGSGGCGNVGMVSTGDVSDIFYLNSYTLENRVLEFILKCL
ncbi:MAG: M56 family metallopeptidase [Lachnospiraceae bacterium]|nr:M56 family metallopeptidase [Lachnospiraceae bacterium]